jgi:3-deoxy-manno-octulosonate cytidylyltransferase (CMP-KDO synthetase)
MKTIGVIPARWASTRFPGKSLAPICGKPLILWVIERARRARRLDEVLVATDDARIADAVRTCGAPVVMTRPEHPSGTDRVAEAVAGRGADAVINIQGDEPLIDPGLLDCLADAMASDAAWDMVTAAAPIGRLEDLASPSVVKVVCDARGQALYFSRAPIPFVRDAGGGALCPLHRRHIGVYGYRAAFLARLVQTPPCELETAEKLEQLRALHIGGRIRVLESVELGIGVDMPADVPYVEGVIRSRGEA